MCYGWAFGLGAMPLDSTATLTTLWRVLFYVCAIRSHKYNIRVEECEEHVARIETVCHVA